jgi:peptidoglycan hydrolase-like protein with peptidoglycan-binding domain
MARTFGESLERSRRRRSALAARLASVRERRRRRSGSLSAGTVLALATLGAPLALGQSSAQAPTPAQRGGLLTVGTVSSSVAAVQRALGVTPASGRFGPITLGAVRAFQRRKGLTVDGIVGPQTLAALGLASSVSSASVGGSTTLSRIAQCESGGNPRAIGGPGGIYRGKYQFTYGTWRAMGGSGDPAAASESEQDQRAARLLAARGTAPWPACGR